MKHLIVGTAGHIDHGKSSLVKALTGIDPDRLKEEKERGLTIDLGFAHFDLPDGNRVAFVDVPGHERFVKNMLAGAAGMDIVILVVDATESVMPQTREHLDIMRLLGISQGIIAITKIDLADKEMTDIVEEELKDLLKDTFLENAPVARVSSKTGEGMEDLRRMIEDAVNRQQKKSESGLFRFPIDRVFTMKGFGTVVTGTVFSGSLEEDEPVLILPKGMQSRARQLQSHKTKLERVSAGMRAALNLANVSVHELKRGDTLVRPGTAEATNLVDARVQLLPSAPRALSRSSTVKLYAATSQCLARMTLIDNMKLQAGEEAYARLRLSQPLCIFRGDHFVLRGESPEFTIGGGTVLDVAPSKLKRKDQNRSEWLKTIEKADSPQLVLAFLSQMKTGAGLHEIARRMDEPFESVQRIIAEHERNGYVLSADVGGDLFAISRECFEQLNTRLMQELTAFFKSNPHRLSMPREELRSRLGSELLPQFFEKSLKYFVDAGEIESASDGVRLSNRRANLSKTQLAAKQQIEKIFIDAAFSPPTFSQIQELLDNAAPAKQVTSLLIEEGTLVKISPTLAYHRDSMEAATSKIKNHFTNADTLGVGDLKEILGISRKHAVPLLEYFDKIGLTLRKGNYRVLKKQSST